MVKVQTPIETFLAPLAKLAVKHPDMEAEVIWANGGEWDAQGDATERLDAEEIAFYAEGLMVEGFCLHWQVLAETTAPADPVHVRLFFWQGDAPEISVPEASLSIFASGIWTT